MLMELDATVPAQEIKRRGIGMLNERLKRGPVWIVSGNRPKYVVLDVEEYRRQFRDAFDKRILLPAGDGGTAFADGTPGDGTPPVAAAEARAEQRLRRRWETPVSSGGAALHPDVTSTAELLAIAEGEDFK